jgi:hypothetical protein
MNRFGTPIQLGDWPRQNGESALEEPLTRDHGLGGWTPLHDEPVDTGSGVHADDVIQLLLREGGNEPETDHSVDWQRRRVAGDEENAAVASLDADAETTPKLARKVELQLGPRLRFDRLDVGSRRCVDRRRSIGWKHEGSLGIALTVAAALNLSLRIRGRKQPAILCPCLARAVDRRWNRDRRPKRREEALVQRIGLSDAIADLRSELTRAFEQGADEPLKFEIGTVDLELEIELTVGGTAKAETKWWVVSAGAEARGERSTHHRIKLTMTPTMNGQTLQIRSKKTITD